MIKIKYLRLFTGLLFIIAVMLTALNITGEKTTANASAIRGWSKFDSNGIFEEYGREGVRLNSDGKLFATIYSQEKYDMNKGIRLNFTVNSVPGCIQDVDHWLGIYLQNGTQVNPELTTNEGFKFLLKNTSENHQRGLGTLAQRIFVYPSGSNNVLAPLPPLQSKVPLGGNEHSLTIFSVGEDEGFIVAYNDTFINYAFDPQTSLLKDLSQANIVIRAYNSKFGQTDNWDVVINSIEQLSGEDNWIVTGNSIIADNDEGLSIIEKNGFSANQKVFYNSTINVDNITEINLTIDQIPGYFDKGNDSYIALTFSNMPYNDDLSDFRTMLCLFKVKNSQVLMGSFGLASTQYYSNNYTLLDIRPQEEIIIKFGFDAEGIAVLTINDVVVGFTSQLRKNNFINRTGYIAISTFNGNASEDSLNWGYTITKTSQYEGEMPLISKLNNDNTDNDEEDNIENSEDYLLYYIIAGSSVLLMVSVLVFIIIYNKKFKRNTHK